MTTYSFGSSGLETAQKVAAFLLKNGAHESNLGKKDGVIILTTEAAESTVTVAYRFILNAELYPSTPAKKAYRNPDDGHHMDPYAEMHERGY